jgi:hypothetical protein
MVLLLFHTHSKSATSHQVLVDRCFNHTIQLSAKALLRPFSASPTVTDNDNGSKDEEHPEKIYKDHKDGRSDNDNNGEDHDHSDNGDDDGEEEEDPLDVLDEEAHEQLLEDTVVVRTMLNKVCTVISCFLSIYSCLISLDLKTIFCCHPLNNYSSSCMAQDLYCSQTFCLLHSV